MEITGWHYAQLIDIVNKCPVARAEQGNSAPTAEDEVGTTLDLCQPDQGDWG
jgi:hypothetical protein